MRTPTVSENIIRYLKTSILLGELAPGQKLNEKELSLSLNVSSAPLREAFRILQNEYLITAIPRKGAFVTEISIEDCRQIHRVRIMIERCAIDYLESRDIREVADGAGTEISGAPFFNDIDEKHSVLVTIYKELSQFHINLVAETGNSWLTRLYNSIYPTLARYQFIGYEPRVMKLRSKAHKEITKLIKEGDFSQAKKMLTQHINFFLAHLENVMKKKNMV